jgi:hypothetical protein
VRVMFALPMPLGFKTALNLNHRNDLNDPNHLNRPENNTLLSMHLCPIPKLRGSRFRVQAYRGATECSKVIKC